MKKLGMVAICIAGSLFASSFEKNTNDELVAMISGADAKMMSEISFELHKRAGVLSKQANKIRADFRDKMRSKISTLKEGEREQFMSEFRKNYDQKIDGLSVKEAKNFGFFGKKDRREAGNCKIYDRMSKNR